MHPFRKTRYWMCLGLCVAVMPKVGSAAPQGKVRLFILSGQSNMAHLDPAVSFTPAMKKAFPGDEVIVVKNSETFQALRMGFAHALK